MAAVSLFFVQQEAVQIIRLGFRQQRTRSGDFLQQGQGQVRLQRLAGVEVIAEVFRFQF